MAAGDQTLAPSPPALATASSSKGKIKVEEVEKAQDVEEVRSICLALANSSKGKVKVEDVEKAEEEEDEEVCGICLAGGSKAPARGRIDCCSHRFCFVCIMRWARVETRCPLCKLRFSSVRRPPIPGLFPVERVVGVVHRDQVYHPLGNESSTLTDPYADTDCGICHTISDENLMLLCELCDMAAHTYCIGLGVTVPEGDWYCDDCAASKDEHSQHQRDDDSCKHENSKPGEKIPWIAPAAGYVSANSTEEISTTDATTSRGGHDQRNRGEVLSSSSKVVHGDRGLGCLRTHRIRVFRDNWAALRSGSLAFASDKLKNVQPNSNNMKRTDEVPAIQQEPLTGCSTSKAATDINSKDVDKSWKILECAMAKGAMKMGKIRSVNGSISRDISDASGRNSSVIERAMSLKFSVGHQKSQTETNSSKPRQQGDQQKLCSVPHRPVKSDVKTTPIHKRMPEIKTTLACTYQRMNGNGINVKRAFPDFSYELNRPQTENIVQKLQQRGRLHIPGKEPVPTFCGEHPRHQDIGREMNGLRISNCVPKCELVMASDDQSSVEESSKPRCLGREMLSTTYREHGTGENREPNAVLDNLEINANEQATNVKLTLSYLTHMTEDNADDKVTSSSKRKCTLQESVHRTHKKKLREDAQREKKCSDGSIKSINDAKNEVLALVKLNLKVLRVDKVSGSEVFRDVARMATHTILAACGMKHSESATLKCSPPTCRHNEASQRESLMRGACRKCFCIFVKQVVDSALASRPRPQG